MNVVFADTFYYLALLSENDFAHDRAVQVSRELRAKTMTTAWVLTEVGDALAGPADRPKFIHLIEQLRSAPQVTIVPPSETLFERGFQLFSRRPDKDWSLTDCISFEVMQEHQLRDALTGDRHFEQAGFQILL
jgi:predicted nucleic acid-binding protein